MTELEEHAQVHFRLAALADMTAFPPQVTTPTAYEYVTLREGREGGRVARCLSENGRGEFQDAGTGVEATHGGKQGG